MRDKKQIYNKTMNRCFNLLKTDPKTFEERVEVADAIVTLMGAMLKINFTVHEGEFAYVDAENHKRMAVKKSIFNLKDYMKQK